MRSSANRYTLYGALFGACFPLFATLLAAFMAYGTVGTAELVAVQRSVPLLWIIDSAPFWLGLFARFGGIQLDRLQATHARLQESEQRFRSVVDSLGEGVVLTDLDGHVTYANPQAGALAGTRVEDLTGCSLPALLDVAADELGDERPAPAGEASYRTVELRRAQGPPAFVEVRRSLVQGEAGRCTEVVAVLADITARLQLEEQLRQAQKMEAVGKLAGGIAHDFNNMLTAIGGFASVLQSEMDESDPRCEYVHEIVRAASRSTDLTRQLLAFGRKQVLQPRALDLNQVIRGMEPMLRRLIGADIAFVTRCGFELPPVLADPGQLEQVLLNLVVNARDAMAGGGRLVLETAAKTIEAQHAHPGADLEPGPYVLLRVSDSGCGMDRETQARIFEPFFTTKPVGKGTGLGLSTVYGIVKQSGGHVEVESTPERGTTFHVYLPCASQPSAPLLNGSAAHPRDGVATVLLVDDEPAVRTLAASIVRRLGYRVLEAGDGEEALRLAQQPGLRVQLLLTDVVMPRLNGTALAAELRRRHPDLPIIFMSGYSEHAITSNGVLEAGTIFLSKPFSPETLGREVRQAMQADSPASPAVSPPA